MFRFSILLGLVALTLFLNVPVALACSGFVIHFFEDDVETADILVKAQVIEMDDLNQNGILRVESYLKGGPGSQYILLYRTNPGEIAALTEGRTSGGDCRFIYNDLAPGDIGYWRLNRQVSGAYVGEQLPQSSSNSFPVILQGDFDLDEEFSEEELINYVEELTGSAAVAPAVTTDYPLTAPLQITTASGSQYLLPIDRMPPIPFTSEIANQIQFGDIRFLPETAEKSGCPDFRCVRFSPNWVDAAFMLDENTISINGSYTLPGQGFLFAPDGNYIAVWNDSTLNTYFLENPYGPLPTPRPSSTVNLTPLGQGDFSSFVERAVWSPDGRMLSYTDAEGLWLWSRWTTDGYQRLLIPTSDGVIPYASHFSPLGRYLAVTIGEIHRVIDLVTGLDITHDGIVSPDECFVLSFEPKGDPPLELRINRLHACANSDPFQDQGNRLISWSIWSDYHVTQAIWKDRFSYIAAACRSADLASCHVFEENITDDIAGFFIGHREQGYAFDYDFTSGRLVVLQNKNTISIDGEDRDLSQWLDGDIVQVKWLPSLFYHE